MSCGDGRGLNPAAPSTVSGGDELEDAHAIVAVGDEGIHGCGDGTDLHGADIVQFAIGGEELVEARALGMVRGCSGSARLTTFKPSSSVTKAYWN